MKKVLFTTLMATSLATIAYADDKTELKSCLDGVVSACIKGTTPQTVKPEVKSITKAVTKTVSGQLCVIAQRAYGRDEATPAAKLHGWVINGDKVNQLEKSNGYTKISYIKTDGVAWVQWIDSTSLGACQK